MMRFAPLGSVEVGSIMYLTLKGRQALRGLVRPDSAHIASWHILAGDIVRYALHTSTSTGATDAVWNPD